MYNTLRVYEEADLFLYVYFFTHQKYKLIKRSVEKSKGGKKMGPFTIQEILIALTGTLIAFVINILKHIILVAYEDVTLEERIEKLIKTHGEYAKAYAVATIKKFSIGKYKIKRDNIIKFYCSHQKKVIEGQVIGLDRTGLLHLKYKDLVAVYEVKYLRSKHIISVK